MRAARRPALSVSGQRDPILLRAAGSGRPAAPPSTMSGSRRRRRKDEDPGDVREGVAGEARADARHRRGSWR